MKHPVQRGPPVHQFGMPLVLDIFPFVSLVQWGLFLACSMSVKTVAVVSRDV